MPNLKWRIASSIKESTPNNSVLGANLDNTASSTPTNFVTELTMTNNSSFTYYIVVWINETDVDQPIDIGKTFHGVIDFNSSNGTGVTSTFA